MYSQTLKQALRIIVDEYEEIGTRGRGVKLKPSERNRLIDTILFELWMRGFAVSARTPGLRPAFRRDDHEAWRKSRLQGQNSPGESGEAR